MSERRVLLIVHTAREEATSLAARLASDLRSADCVGQVADMAPAHAPRADDADAYPALAARLVTHSAPP